MLFHHLDRPPKQRSCACSHSAGAVANKLMLAKTVHCASHSLESTRQVAHITVGTVKAAKRDLQSLNVPLASARAWNRRRGLALMPLGTESRSRRSRMLPRGL